MLTRLRPQFSSWECGLWRKETENWIYWIIGDLISVPLYLYKGLVFTSFQYLLFTIIAIYGYRAWKKLNIPETSLLN